MTKLSLDINGPVSGEMFIGRRKYLQNIESSLLFNCASYSVYGENRIGKTSFIRELQRRVLEKNSNINFIWVYVSQYVDCEFGYCKMLKFILMKVVRKLEEDNVEDDFFFEDLEDLEENSVPDTQELLRDAVRLAKENGIKFVLVLDDFDAAKDVFEGKSGRYQYLRGLKGPMNGLPAIIISRKPITEIEVPYDGGSLLSLTLNPIHLGEFDETDMLEVYDRLCKSGINLTDDEKFLIENITGKKPHELNRLCNILAENKLQDVKRSIEDVIADFKINNN